ncbi:MAG: hypothetical protein IJ849_00065 [Selenomonadaceae bacterium]|nr:hypothetical protein [Selenomonadaceae bacterium]
MGFFSKSSGTGCPDVPVMNRQEDRFNVGQYINGLSSFILNCDTPMTISIQGDWGSGKTSMMNMIEANINTLVWPIWFNTWQFSQFSLGNALPISMMEVLLKRLDGDSKLLSKIAGGLKGLAKNAILTATEMTAGSRVADKIEDVAAGVASTSYVAEILALKEQFQQAVNAKLTETGRQRVVIFVDDLDRLHPAKAVELLEVLKLFLDCENCVFVLAVDYEVVTMGIKQKYGSDVDAQKGKSFFDKIIQLPFKMPVAQYDIAGYVKSMMERMKAEVTEENVKLFADLVKNSIGLNPRSMKRLFNTYQLLDIITKGTVQNIPEIRRQKILFATVCVQMYSDSLYNYLATGNVDSERLTELGNITAVSVAAFAEKRSAAGFVPGDEGNSTILDDIFGREKFTAETARNLRGLPRFLRYFLAALREDANAPLTSQDALYLRDILQCTAITSVGSENTDEISQTAWDKRYANRRLVQATNELLTDTAKFAVYQSRKREDGIISTECAGYTLITHADNEYKLQYNIDTSDRDGVCVNLYLADTNGYKKGRAELFYRLFGENPLGYPGTPPTDEWGWYYYDNMLTVNEQDTNAPKQIAHLVRDAYKRLTKFLQTLDSK